MTREIGLVSCTGRKHDGPVQPADLYMKSSYFRKMRAYAEENHDTWYILSAKHRLLDPYGDPIEKYDVDIRDFGISEREHWASQVFEDLLDREDIDAETTLVIHAGKKYYESLLPLLEELNPTIEIPTEGLQIGDTEAWYKERL